MGGSDQWGNITTGAELYAEKRVQKLSDYMSFNKKSDGSKFGKTEEGNVWLDETKLHVTNFINFG